jgi:hypothetical protein
MISLAHAMHLGFFKYETPYRYSKAALYAAPLRLGFACGNFCVPVHTLAWCSGLQNFSVANNGKSDRDVWPRFPWNGGAAISSAIASFHLVQMGVPEPSTTRPGSSA